MQKIIKNTTNRKYLFHYRTWMKKEKTMLHGALVSNDESSDSPFMIGVGLEDINGRNIFVDDIYEKQGELFVVQFGHYTTNDDIRQKCSAYGFYGLSADGKEEPMIGVCVEVVGNRHENPELFSGFVLE